jgi:MFS family permease
LHRRKHLEKLLFADVCQGSGFLIMLIGLISQWIVLCYFGFLVFTIGEILGNIAYTPYLMINTSEEKRGRLMGIFSMMFKLSAIIFNPILGFIYDRNVYVSWGIVFLVEFIVVMLYLFVLKPKSEGKKENP